MLSKKAKYALKALLFLSKNTDRGVVLIAEISETEGIPKKFLEQILLELKKQGILQSKRGKEGGYFLGKPANEIGIGQVVRIIDGPLAPIPCVSKMAYRRCDECIDEKTCEIRNLFLQVRDATIEILDKTSLSDLEQKNIL
ncbi:RrF2 family transcriptional regulator [Cytophaga hutchinsonii]|jgi:Rrf2 family protein|uniref:Transcriptional regulator, BadM/Rrf2 family n=1 Tax=Cytophaga hutchinsonii (strain ATCC 33406 / DSM 1761 / CIP 103989 / NBRC 15051 / NCIMB 9469 / D465) TaxID=269798 RepID=A0A6N4SMJ0_CYTH3|nr:Rrf2 family transcriptional regulator [Cytophaga hutchinsonii]ABG57489.1 transcriptional regulator, BadM/Rrf2 family [Cytophaga hutchinsonii ATCC 33406]SFW98519.1 transcriptional regulator, BadM/Rrf2 family [Cytophaga hutchinsonii ATCC 33406]